MEYVKVDLNFLKSQDQMRLNVRALLTTLQVQCEQMGYELHYAARTNFCKLTHVDAKTGAEHELVLSADPIGLSNVSSTLDFVWVSQGHDSLLPKKKAVEKRDYGLLGFPPKPADGAGIKAAAADPEGAPVEPATAIQSLTGSGIGTEGPVGTDVGGQKLNDIDLDTNVGQDDIPDLGAGDKNVRHKKHKNKPPKPQPDPVAERLQQLARRADKIHSCLVVEGKDAIYARNMQWDDCTAYRQNHQHDSRGFIFKIPEELDLLRRFIKSDEELWHGF